MICEDAWGGGVIEEGIGKVCSLCMGCVLSVLSASLSSTPRSHEDSLIWLQ